MHSSSCALCPPASCSLLIAAIRCSPCLSPASPQHVSPSVSPPPSLRRPCGLQLDAKRVLLSAVSFISLISVLPRVCLLSSRGCSPRLSSVHPPLISLPRRSSPLHAVPISLSSVADLSFRASSSRGISTPSIFASTMRVAAAAFLSGAHAGWARVRAGGVVGRGCEGRHLQGLSACTRRQADTRCGAHQQRARAPAWPRRALGRRSRRRRGRARARRRMARPAMGSSLAARVEGRAEGDERLDPCRV